MVWAISAGRSVGSKEGVGSPLLSPTEGVSFSAPPTAGDKYGEVRNVGKEGSGGTSQNYKMGE